MLKVMTLLGTRPELIKMSCVIEEFDRYTQHVLVHTGQNFDYELNQVFFDDMGIRKPDHFLNAVGKTVAQTIATIIEKADALFEIEKPDALLLYGDTNSTLAVIAAKRRKIPVFHMEAGNRCFDQRVPEELNRKVLDHLSDINLVLTEHARRYLLDEGIKPETIFKTGSHMPEVLSKHQEKINQSTVLTQQGLRAKNYFLVSSHREENVDDPTKLSQLLDTLNALADVYKMPVLVSTHPRTRKRMEALNTESLDPLIQFSKPFGFTDYIKLQREALCVVSDSGTITEEASLLNLAAVNIRDCHERPEGMDVGSVIFAGTRKEQVLEAVRVTLAQHDSTCAVVSPIADYIQSKSVSKQVLRIVMSYAPYVNRTVWHKPDA